MTVEILKSITNSVQFVRDTVEIYFKGISEPKGDALKCPYSEDTYTNRFSMKLTPIAANQNEVEFTNGTQVRPFIDTGVITGDPLDPKKHPTIGLQ